MAIEISSKVIIGIITTSVLLIPVYYVYRSLRMFGEDVYKAFVKILFGLIVLVFNVGILGWFLMKPPAEITILPILLVLIPALVVATLFILGFRQLGKVLSRTKKIKIK